MAITVEMRTQVSQLYVSLFGRAPDSEGLGFWVSALAGGMTVSQIAESMYNTAPARTYYPAFATNQEIVATFYLNVLGRPADDEGLAFWTKELAAAPSKGAFFTKLLGNVVNYTGTDAAGLKSQALFLNKVAVAQFYGETNGKIDGATAALNGVTELPASVDAAKAAITVGTGQTFILTTSQDNVIGTAANDTIRGIYEGEDATVTVGDSVDGGAGNDVLELTATDGYSTEPGFIVKNVETINIRDLVGASFDAYSVENAPAINFTQTVAGNESIVTNAALASRFGLSGKGDMIVEYASTSGSADTANVALATAGTSAKVASHVHVENGNTIEAVNVATSGTNFVELHAGTAAAAVTITGNGTNDIVVASMKTTSTIDASASTGTNTINVGTQLSNKDVIKGGTGLDTVKFNAIAALGEVVFTGVETLAGDFDVNSTLNLDGSTGVKTLNLDGLHANVVVSNATAELNTVNFKDATDYDFSLNYLEDENATLTMNLGSATDAEKVVEVNDISLTNVQNLTLNAIGYKDDDWDDIEGIDFGAAKDVNLTINVASEASFSQYSEALRADSFNDVKINVGESAYFSAYWIDAVDGGIGEFTLTAEKDAYAEVDYMYASGAIGDITLTAARDAYVSVDADIYTSDDDFGNIELNADGTNSYVSLDASTSGGAFGNIALNASGANASAYFSGYASGGAGNITVTATGESAYASFSGDSSDGSFEDITVNASGSNASAIFFGSADSGVGDITINATGAGSFAHLDISAFNGDVGNIEMNVGDYAYGSAYVSAGGSIGDITVDAGDYTSAYVSAYGESIGETNVTIGDDAAFAAMYSAGEDGTIGAINITAGDDAYNGYSGFENNEAYAGVDLAIWGAGHVEAVNITAGAGSSVNVVYGYTESGYSESRIESADGVTITGGGAEDQASFVVFNNTYYDSEVYNSAASGEVGTLDSINMAAWNGEYFIDLENLETGTTIYAAKKGGDIIGSQGTDVIYLGAGSDHVNIVAETNGNDMVYGFKAGSNGDLIEFNSNFTNFDFIDDFQNGIYSGASESAGLQDFIFADVESAVEKLEAGTNAHGDDYSYMFMVDGGNDVVVYFADYFNDVLVYEAVATLVGVSGADLTADNFSLTAIPATI